MATLTVQTMDSDGLSQSLVAAAGGGDAFTWSQYTFFMVANGDGTDTDITFASEATVKPGLAQSDKVVTVAAGDTVMIGPFHQNFKDADSLVQVTYEKVTSLTVAAISAAPASS